jgi:hypothetical protein
LSWNPL